MKSRQLVRACGLFMLLPVLFWRSLEGSSGGGVLQIGSTAFACLAFAFAFWDVTRPTAGSLPRMVAGLSAQTFVALALVATGGEFEAMLLSVLAGQLGILLPLRWGASWVVVQTAGLGLAAADTFTPERLAVYVSGHFLFQGFALAAGVLLRDVDGMRMELERVNAELLATRELLADRTRALERVRISRDLHDGLGHGVTALLLSIENARRAPSLGETRTRLEAAAGLGRRLLGDVRQTVGELRKTAPDLERALRSLVADIEHPRIHLAVAPDLPAASPEVFHAIFRSVQEAVTNTLRHSGARNLWISCRAAGQAIEVAARDDGRGMGGAVEGHGLRGMRERARELGGELSVVESGQGLTLRVVVPVRSAEAA